MEKKVIICVPIYKQQLNIFEITSLIQLEKILGKHEICYVAPEGFNPEVFDGYLTYPIEYFDRTYFESIRAYSTLCTSLEFYERFVDYEYMLIYQTDAFVFSDKLIEWCDKGYDYVGAPGLYGFFDSMCAWVGNGGLSLRKVSSCINVLNRYQNILKNHFFSELFSEGEDAFWSYCGVRDDIDFFVPNVYEAQKFSSQTTIGDTFIGNELPFGTHYYYQSNYDKWYPIISNMGYKIPNINEVEFSISDEEDAIRWKRFYDVYFRLKINQTSLNVYEDVDVHVLGAGRIGKECLHVIEMLRCKSINVYDNNINALKGIDILEKHDVKKLDKAIEQIGDGCLLVCINSIDDEIDEIIKSIQRKGNKVLNHKDFIEDCCISIEKGLL